jgi:HPt (histidine-containing phosphotransfer) domain-containing protein
MDDKNKQPVACFNLDISTPLDIKAGIETFGGSEKLYYMMLEKFEEMTVEKYVRMVNKAVEEQDWVNVKEGAHAIKGSAGYIGASHV